MTSPRSPFLEHLFFLIETSLILILCAGVVGLLTTDRTNFDLRSYFFGAVGLPTIAGSVFVLAGATTLSFTGGRRMKFPLNLTFPVVFVSIFSLIVLMLTTPQGGIVAVPAQLRIGASWLQPIPLAGVFVSQVLFLTLIAMFSGTPKAKSVNSKI